MASSETVTKRLHIAGLTPNITPAHLKDRFGSFGTVSEVEDMALDPLGEARPFTFLTIETSPAQLKKCLNIMSGSMWRGCQLRLAEAKPRYDIRLEKERNPPAEVRELRLKKKKRRVMSSRGEDVGKEAQDMRMVDLRNYTTKKFWNMTPDRRLLRPICMRPSHPLPPLTSAFALSSDPKAQATIRRPPPTRARRKVINPVLWGSSHLAGEQFESDDSVLDRDIQDIWEYESFDEEELEEADDVRVAIGRWKRRGVVREGEEEVVKVKRARIDGDLDGDFYAGDKDDEEVQSPSNRSDRSASPLFGTRAERAPSPPSPTASRSTSPLFASRTNQADVPASSSPSSARSSSPALRSSSPASSRSTSPLFATRHQASPPPTEDAHPSSKAALPAGPRVDVPDQVRSMARSERSLALGVLGFLLGEEVKADRAVTRSEWAGFAEDDSDEEDDDAGRYEVEQARAKTPVEPIQPETPERNVMSTLDYIEEDAASPALIAFDAAEINSEGLNPIGSNRSITPDSTRAELPDHNILSTTGFIEEDSAPPTGTIREGGSVSNVAAVDVTESGIPPSESNSASGSSSSGSTSSSASAKAGKGGKDMDKSGRGAAGGDEASSSDSESDGAESGAGGGDDDDDDEDDSSDDSSESSSEDSDESDSDSDEEEEEDAGDKGIENATAEAVPALPTAGPSNTSKSRSTLKDMFAPAPATSGFSLLASLDADIEMDELDIPMTVLPATTDAEEAEFSLEPLATTKKSHFDPDPSIPLFFSGANRGKGGRDLMVEEQSQPGHVGFWAQETDEEMKEIWERDKAELTRDWKVRNREGKKQRKRRGGGDDVE